ncbi:MAG TPA: hypothetical protein VEU47_14205 [Candidatus Cybelea sp.]|nr:hypothetical protein [Candidatus Cybelea sp.]
MAMTSLAPALCKRFGIRYPIFGFSHSIEVTAAITNAGGLGVHGATRDTPEEIEHGLRAIRQMVGDLLGAIDEHDVEPLVHYPAGQSIAYFNRVTTVAEVMADFVREAETSLRRLGTA